MNITWLIFIVVVLIIAQGLFFRKTGLWKLGYQRYFQVTTCYEGDQVEMVERISNRKAIPVPWVRLDLPSARI